MNEVQLPPPSVTKTLSVMQLATTYMSAGSAVSGILHTSPTLQTVVTPSTSLVT